MKKILAVISAIAVLGASTAATAQSVTFSIQTQDRYERDYRYRDHQDRFDRYVQEREARRWYAMQRSYYRGRCERHDIVVRDPYTGRRVCVDRYEYRVFLRNQPRYR
jgi:hypothetical protein